MQSIRVLLVEDDEDDYLLTRELLGEAADHEFEIDWAKSYEAAVTQIRSGSYDAFLVDYRLGRRSGLDLLCGVLEGGRVGPVIILTGQDMRDVDVEAKKLGATAYLMKGKLDAAGLARTLREAVDSHAARNGVAPTPAAAPEKATAAPAKPEEPAASAAAQAPASASWPSSSTQSFATSSWSSTPAAAASVPATPTVAEAEGAWVPTITSPASASSWSTPRPSSSPWSSPGAVSWPSEDASTSSSSSWPTTATVSPSSARVFSFLGVKGGCGTTTVVANVASALRARGRSVLAIELRGDYGNLARLLRVDVISDITTLLELAPGSMDERRFHGALGKRADGLRLLAAPQIPQRYREATAEQLRAIVEMALAHFDIVLVDLPSASGAAQREMLALSDLVALVLDRDSECIESAQRTLALLQSLPISAGIGSIVVSRASLPDMKTVAEINAELGVKKLGAVPSATELFLRAAAEREPAVLGQRLHPAARSLEELASLLVKQPAAVERGKEMAQTG